MKRCEKLFNQVFNLKNSFVYKSPESTPPAASESADSKLNPREVQKALMDLAKSHLKAAEELVKQVEAPLRSSVETRLIKTEQPLHISKATRDYLDIVKVNVANLKQAIARGQVTLGLLEDSRKKMMGQPEFADPLENLPIINGQDYRTEIGIDGKPTPLKIAKESLLMAAINRGNDGNDRKYNRKLEEFVLARQSLRDRGQLDQPKDRYLAKGQELSDAIRISQMAEDGRYPQKSLQTLRNREDQLTAAFLRESKAVKLKSGETLDLGCVRVTKAQKGEVYLLSVAEGGFIKGQATAIPVITIIDLEVNKERVKVKREISAAKIAAERASKAYDALPGSTDQAKLEAARQQVNSLRGKVADLEAKYDHIQPADYDAFPKEAEADSTKVADIMITQLSKSPA